VTPDGLERHPSLDERYDPAVRIVDYDPDFLRAHAGEVARYEDLKRRRTARHPEDRLAYIEGKDESVARLETRALEWARG
jgi:hypothetical protein